MSKKIGIVFFFTTIFIALFIFKLNKSYPSGIAGLYSEFSLQICKGELNKPSYIHNYGGGNIPFAYQPLSFYVYSLATCVLGLDQWFYTLFFPSTMMFLSSILIFSISRLISKNFISPLITTILFIFSHEIIAYHYGADGVCRGLALVISLLIVYSMIGTKKLSPISAYKNGFLLGLITITHGVYCLFSYLFFISYSLLGNKESGKKKVAFIFKAIIVSLIVSFPWWSSVIRYYGPNILVNAFLTHGNVYGLSYFLSLERLNRLLSNVLFNYHENPLLLIFSSVGILINISKKHYTFPIIMAATIPIIGYEGYRFIIICQVLNALSCLDLLMNLSKTYTAKIINIMVIVFLFIQNTPLIEKQLKETPTFNFEGAIDIGKKINFSSFLLVSPDINEQEWFPHLTKAKSIISPFGAEWTGEYWYQTQKFEDLQKCSLSKNDACISELLESTKIKPEIIIYNNQYISDGTKPTIINDNYSYTTYDELFQNK